MCTTVLYLDSWSFSWACRLSYFPLLWQGKLLGVIFQHLHEGRLPHTVQFSLKLTDWQRQLYIYNRWMAIVLTQVAVLSDIGRGALAIEVSFQISTNASIFTGLTSAVIDIWGEDSTHFRGQVQKGHKLALFLTFLLCSLIVDPLLSSLWIKASAICLNVT